MENIFQKSEKILTNITDAYNLTNFIKSIYKNKSYKFKYLNFVTNVKNGAHLSLENKLYILKSVIKNKHYILISSYPVKSYFQDILETELNLIIVATGSEVSLAIEVAIMMKELDNMNIRVISMPSTNLFDKQDEIYKKSVLHDSVKKMSLEAGSTLGWHKYVDFTYGIDTFGESGKINDLKNYFGFTKENIRIFIINKFI